VRLPRYPRYKASGVEWLGEVPAHWVVDRFKWSTHSCRNGIWGDDAGGGADDIACVRVADFDRGRLRVELKDPTIRAVTAQERVGRQLVKGDLLLEKSGGGDLQPVGCVMLYDDDRPAVCSNFIARMELASGMDPSFWRYMHHAAYCVRINSKSIKQTSGIQNLDQQAYLNEATVFPPLPEQLAISDFLDRETARIDALAAEQQQLIGLLKEKREAVISHAITKGLTADAPMKDSGVEWLGHIPAHWQAVRAGRHLSVVSGYAFPSSGFTDDVDHVRLLRGINVGVGRLRWDEVVYWQRQPADGLELFELQAGDLVIGMDRPLISEGMRVATVTSEDLPCLLLQRVASLRADAALHLDFLALLLRSSAFVAHFAPDTTGVSVPHISPDQVRAFVIPLPPVAE